MRWTAWCALAFPLAAAGGWYCVQGREHPLPPGLAGSVVFVSDREGSAALYLRRLPGGENRHLASLESPAAEPAFSHDGRRVAFGTGGRIGIVSLATGAVRFATAGAEWKDASPSWRSDDKALLVSARRARGEGADVHLLALDGADGEAGRTPLTETPADEATPVFAPLDAFAVFVREDSLFRLDLRDGRTRRLTGGFKRVRSPRFLPSGRLVCLWTEGKQHGIDVMDFDGKNRETLWQGTTYYRTLAPSPDGRFFAATFTYDLAFHATDLLGMRQEEVRLLDAHGTPVAVLARAWRHANHSPDWGG